MREDQFPNKPQVRKFLLWLLRLLMKLLLRFEVAGYENVPGTGPIVIIINHIAFLDPVMVLGSFPRRVIPMAKIETLDIFFWGPIAKAYGVIPVRRGEVDIKAIKSALRILSDNGVVLLAPEGTRSPNHQLQSGKEGAALIALRSGASVVPIGITGTHRVNAHWKKLRRAPVFLSIGKPFRLCPAATNGRAQRAQIKAMTRAMMFRLAAQLPPEFRGIYANLEVEAESFLKPLES
jgi:1-acyl-sn-glycerol-3-phosphate acyltransferase